MKSLICIALILSAFNIEASQAEDKRSYAQVVPIDVAPKQQQLYGTPETGFFTAEQLYTRAHTNARPPHIATHHPKPKSPSRRQLRRSARYLKIRLKEKSAAFERQKKHTAQLTHSNEQMAKRIAQLSEQLRALRSGSVIIRDDAENLHSTACLAQIHDDHGSPTSSSSSEQSDDELEVVEHEDNFPTPETPVSRSPVVSPHSPRSLSPVRTLGIHSPTDTLAAAVARQQQKINEELLQRALEKSQDKSASAVTQPFAASSSETAPAATPIPVLALAATPAPAPAPAAAPARSGLLGWGTWVL